MEKYPADAISMIKQHYSSLPSRLSVVRQQLERGLTMAEKVLFAHWQDTGEGLPVRGESTVQLRPDRAEPCKHFLKPGR